MSWINAARTVVKQSTAYQVDIRTGHLCARATQGQRKGTKCGVILDLFTASMLTQIYDKLSESNRTRFDSLPILKAVKLGWALVKT